MTEHGLSTGDRVRIDTCDGHHGRHGEVTDVGDDRLSVSIDEGDTETFYPSDLCPMPNVPMELAEREHDVVTNLWGRTVSSDLRKETDERLWDIKRKVSKTVDQCYEDDDMGSLGILLGIELKVSQVLSERRS